MYQKICEGCKIEFNSIRKKIRFCSKLCSNKHVKKNHIKKIRICENCKGEFSSKRKRKMCSKKCIDESRKKTIRFHKLSEEKIHQIIKWKKSGWTLKKIGEELDINPRYVGQIAYDDKKMFPTILREKCFSRTAILKNLPELTQIQKEIIDGSLLGDGTIEKMKGNANARFGKQQKSESFDYLKYVFDNLKPFSKSFVERTVENTINIRLNRGPVTGNRKKFLKINIMRTVSHPFFTELRRKWYPKGIKIVPRDIKLTPLMLAIWFCDDGSNHKNNKEAIIHTQGFQEEDINFLIGEMFNLFNIESKINYDGLKLPVIRIGAKSYENFINIIKPYVVFDCMKYKTIIYNYKGPTK